MSTSPPTTDHGPLPELGPPWKLTRSLGRGGIAEVFEATHPTLGRVAVKVLLAAHNDRSDIADRMRLEAEILAHLRHPNIVEVYGMGSTVDGCPFYAMEYLTGESLLAMLERRGRLPSSEAIDIALGALAGLDAAHRAGVVHRDVKPGNVYIVETPAGTQVKLVDFGLAKLTATAGTDGPAPLMVPTGKGTVVGTPRYLSPEQITGNPVDARTDLYALGLVLYRMLVGKGPFDDIQDFADVMRAQVTVVPTLPSSCGVAVPRWLDLVTMRALAKNPERRFASAAEFAGQLEGVRDPSVGGAACTAAAPSFAASPVTAHLEQADVPLGGAADAAPQATSQHFVTEPAGSEDATMSITRGRAAALPDDAVSRDEAAHACDAGKAERAVIALTLAAALAWVLLAFTLGSGAAFGGP